MNTRAAFVLCAAFGLMLSQMRPAPAAAGYCEIELINTMHSAVIVHGTFDDGHPLAPFRMHPGEAPHYISLYYYGTCHSGMRLTVEAIHHPHNQLIYNAWTHTGATVRMVPH